MSLTQKNAIITGASQGLGRAIATAYVDAGANVMLCARDKSRLEKLGHELAGKARAGQKIFWQTCDVSAVNEVEELTKAGVLPLTIGQE